MITVGAYAPGSPAIAFAAVLRFQVYILQKLVPCPLRIKEEYSQTYFGYDDNTETSRSSIDKQNMITEALPNLSKGLSNLALFFA